MTSPNEALAYLMDTVLEETYENHKTEEAPTLPLYRNDVGPLDGAGLARQMRGVIEAVESGVLTVWRGAAVLISWATVTAHRSFCLARNTVRPRSSIKHGCMREVTLAMYILNYYAPKLHYWIAEGAPDFLVLPINTAAEADLQGLTDALESELKQGIFPDWKSRELLPLDPRYPIIQIATAITHVDPDTFEVIRRLAVHLQGALEQRDFIVEVPSDFVHVSQLKSVECQEFKTRGALYQASALIIFADGGGIGTATTWTIAEESGVPALLLHRPGFDISAARFGALKTREVAEYTDATSAMDAVFRFLSSKERGIRLRAQRLTSLRQMDIGPLQDRFNRIDPLAFEVSPISYEMAMFVLADPVRWGQARPFVTREILAVLGIDGEPLLASQHRNLDRRELLEAYVGLQNLAEVHGLTAPDQASAWRTFLDDVMAPGLSHRPTRKWDYDQWVALLRRSGWQLQ